MGKRSRYTVFLRRLQHKLRAARSGFTLVEMLVIAPLVLIVIAGLVSAMVAMIGDSLVANSRVSTAYSLQDTLNQIEQDTRVTTNFMDNFSYLSSPQGRNGSTGAFSYTSNEDLILTQQATTSSPYNTTRDLIYYADQPAACGSGDMSGNRALADRVIYFLNTSTKTLWRRTIVNPWNLNSTHDGNTVCGTPWQRDSCPQGSTISNTPSSTCQSVDQKMLDNVTDFTPTFYDSSNNVVTDPTQAVNVKVSITVQQSVSGSSLTQTSVMRATRRNDVPVTPVPDAPVVSIYNDGVNDYNNPILTTFQWSANGAYTYLVSTQINGGSWSAQQSVTGTTMGVSAPPGATINIQVTAVNDSGNSPTTSFSTTQDIFTDMNLAGNGICYGNGSSSYYCPQFTRLTSGVVMLRGLVAKASGVITTLPAGFRPKARLIFPVLVTGSVVGRVDIETNGTVSLQVGDGSSWVSLDGIAFPSGASDVSFTWTNQSGWGCDSCTTPWRNYTGGGGYQQVQFTKDAYGRSYLYGLASVPAPYPPTLYTAIAYVPSTPTDYRVPVTNGAIGSPAISGNAYSAITVTNSENGRIEFRTVGSSWQSMSAIYASRTYSQTRISPTMTNGWVNYNTNNYIFAGYSMAPDNMVMVEGKIKNGTVPTSSATVKIFTLNSGYRPAKRMVFLTTGHNTAGDEEAARLDVLPTGDVVINIQTINNSWLNMDGIHFYEDGN